MTSPRHTPACILATMTGLVAQTSEQVGDLLNDLEDRVSDEVFSHACRALAAMDLALDALERLAEEERDARPELRCDGDEKSEIPATESN